MTEREYLVTLGLAKPGKGRYSNAAKEALEKARGEGQTFDTPTVSTKSDTYQTDSDPKSVRAWAKTQGINVGERGRIHADILRQYDQTNPDGPKRAAVHAVVIDDKQPASSDTKVVVMRSGNEIMGEAPRFYPKDSKFVHVDSGGKRHVISDKAACANSGASLSHCGCGNHRSVTNDVRLGLVPVVKV